MNSHLVLLLLALTITLISAKNLHHIEDDNDSNEDPREMMHFNDYFNRLERFQQLFKFLQNPREYDRYQTIAKRAKAIVKGDPREFMG